LIKALSTLIILFSFLFINGQAVDIREVTSKKILRQINEDPTLTAMGKGALFVPYIVDPMLEPHYTIYQDGEYLRDAETGRRVQLNPGDYEIYIGSGPVDLRIKIKATIEEERTTVVIPTWSALIIQTIDQSNNSLRESYQIVNEETKIQIGAGTGADIIRGEQEQAWILKPGLYRIVKRGESPSSFQNFVTVRTQRGKLSTVQMVFDEKTRFVVGGGEVISDIEDYARRGKWSFKAILSANFSLVNSGYISGGTGSTNDISLGSTLNASVMYDDINYLFINRLELNEQFLKPDKDKLRFIKDLLRFESSFIYRINRFVGPYISFRLRAPLFNKHIKTGSDPDNLVTVIERDESTRELQPETNFTYSKSFSTTTLQQGAGLNVDLNYANTLQFTSRAGWGHRQDFNSFNYDVSKISETNEITRTKYFNHQYGPEFYLYFSVFPLSFLELREEFEALVPIEETEKFSFLSKSSAFLWISRFAAIQYEFVLEKSPATTDVKTITSEHTLTVQVYYNFLK
jgi:hypothetical protein